MMVPLVVLATLLAQPVAGASSAAMPPGFTPAPVPNLEITAPQRIESPRPTLTGRLNQPRQPLRSGDGYMPGSNFSEDLQRRSSGGIVSGFAPSVGIKLPLD